jgi:hypothetical protein
LPNEDFGIIGFKFSDSVAIKSRHAMGETCTHPLNKKCMKNLRERFDSGNVGMDKGIIIK